MILVLYGIISCISSFAISFNITTEILRYRDDQDRELNNIEQIKLLKIDSNQKVKFNDNVNFIIIPSFRDLSSDNINELWYTDDEFNKFRIEVIKSRMKNIE